MSEEVKFTENKKKTHIVINCLDVRRVANEDILPIELGRVHWPGMRWNIAKPLEGDGEGITRGGAHPLLFMGLGEHHFTKIS